MREALVRPFQRLFETSPEIEQRPFLLRPRTMAAAWGGMLVCKLGVMAIDSPERGATLFGAWLIAGTLATYLRFGDFRLGSSADPSTVSAAI